MAAQSDFAREQRFYRDEVKAHTKRPSEPGAAKVAASVYGLVSDYGASIGRPFLALGVTLAAFAALYLAMAVGLVRIDPPTHGAPALASARLPSFWHALNFSITNTFRPLSALSAEGLDGNPVAQTLLAGHGQAGGRSRGALQWCRAWLRWCWRFCSASPCGGGSRSRQPMGGLY